MAPVVISSTGIPSQIIDSPELTSLIERLSKFQPTTNNNDVPSDGSAMDIDQDDADVDKGIVSPPFDIDGFIDELKKCQIWRFQEQADLHQWTLPLNAVDAVLDYFLNAYPSLLLVPRDRGSDDCNGKHDQVINPDCQAECAPQHVISSLEYILTFLVTLLRNAINKTIFNSIFELSSLLAASSDLIASLALEALAALATPPMLHRQMTPELASHTTRLHNLTMDSILARRLMDMAKGWGSKGSGLGLFQCINSASTNSDFNDDNSGDDKLPAVLDLSFQCHVKGILVSITLKKEQLISVDQSSTLTNSDNAKRQKTGIETKDSRSLASKQLEQQFKSTAQVFQESMSMLKKDFVEKNGIGDNNKDFSIPPEEQFTLLSTIRLSKAFYQSSRSRVFAVKSRLRALITILYVLSSVESITAYFMAQPELCGELVDLVRPTVSSRGAATSNVGELDTPTENESVNPILILADSPQVPYDVRTLAIEALTALVARRDTAAGTFSIVARQSNVLTELGVGKGQYLGLLPTLIRFSLAALNSFLLQEDANRGTEYQEKTADDNNTGLELGLAFIRATKPPSLPKEIRQERALEFIDTVLTLTSAVISVPSGTSALTDCGMIPALVSTIALDSHIVKHSNNSIFAGANEESYSASLLKFITAQAIQILEGAIVTHTNALSAFHELKGVDVLVQRLSSEVENVRKTSRPEERDVMDNLPDNNYDVPCLQGAQRVLLFSAVNCLTVVFHSQDMRTGANTAPPGGTLIRKPELMSVVLEILNNVTSYGGVMAALVATLLSDIMNSDPQSVHYVHSSGLAKSFLSLLLGKENEMHTILCDDVSKWGEPILEPSGELIMAIPNVISALCLTESGVRAVVAADPFPTLLSILCSPKYAMPQSRCLLSEMSAIIGTGLDEIMRHNPVLRPSIVKAVIQVMKRIVYIGKNLTRQEENVTDTSIDADTLEIERTQLMQYGNNITQLLEQLFHNDDYVSTFLNEGGFNVILELARWSIIPSGRQLVAHASCLSNPSIAALTHSRSASSLSLVVKTIARSNDPHKLLQQISSALAKELDSLNQSVGTLRNATNTPSREDEGEFVCEKLLDGIPCTAIYKLESSNESISRIVDALSTFFRSISTVDWLTNSLATVIKAVIHRTHELGLQRRETGWKKEISSESFEKLVSRLSALHRSSLWEVCRIRTRPNFDERESARTKASEETLLYKLRIVCQEGAIVRNGIEIDGCENVGSAEMGEVVEAFDRCINSSGVLRYQTSRGWISELTRGHARENIVEVIDVERFSAQHVSNDTKDSAERIECSIPDLCSVTATVMTKIHNGQLNLFGSLERLMMTCIRVERSTFSSNNSLGEHVISACRMMSINLQKDLQFPHDQMNDEKIAGSDTIFTENAAKCMYYGNILNLLHASIYEEKRDRSSVNLPLLLSLLVSCGDIDGIPLPSNISKGLIEERLSESKTNPLMAIQFVLHHCLSDVSKFAMSGVPQLNKAEMNGMSLPCKQQRTSRAVASALPPTLTLLKRLVSRSLLVDTQVSNTLTKLKPNEYVSLILDKTVLSKLSTPEISATPNFNANRFTRALHLQMAKTTHDVWLNEKICCAPAHILNPFTAYTGDLLLSLEEGGKIILSPRGNEPGGSSRAGSNSNERANRLLSSLNALLAQNGEEGNGESPEPFSPSEESIDRLSEMGFSREGAIDAIETVESNNVELAMEYLLAHPPSSPRTLERRRAAREQRRNQRQSQNRASRQEISVAGGNPNDNSDAHNQSHTTDESKSKSEETDKGNTETDTEEKAALEAREFADSMKASFVNICLDIIEGSSDFNKYPTLEFSEYLRGNNIGEGDSEGITVIMSNFLLTICKNSDENASNVASALLRRLKENISIKSKEQCEVKEGSQTKFAAIVHACVIVMRTMPKLRPMLLQEGIVICLLHCVRNVTTSPALRDGKSHMFWPSWLAPTLLLLEVMAQPTSVSLETSKEEKNLDDNKRKGEFAKVLSEHKKQSSLLAKGAKMLMDSLQKDKDVKRKKDKKSKQLNAGKHDEGTSLMQIPPFFPLILYEHAEQCMIMCLQLLGLRLKKSSNAEQVSPPPGVVNAILALLIRVVHSHKTATLCLQMGGADLIVALPSRCHFKGCSSLVTLLLRRLLEDETTLQSMMETEIRSQVTKIWRKNNPRSENSTGQPKAALKSFIKAVAPVICRDPMVFVRAFSASVIIEPPSQGSSSLLSSRDSQIVLLTPEQRTRYSRFLASNTNVATDILESSTPNNGSRRANHQEEAPKRRGRSKSPHRKNKLIQLNGSPACHISSLLLGEVFKMQSENDKLSSSKTWQQPFLSTPDYLDILSDLVLAIPACGAAIHRYKPSKNDIFHHVLSGCVDPAQNTVSFLLHKLIPQPRADPKQHDDDEDDVKRLAFIKTKISQSAARLIVCLVARSGEGRRRVIADLMFALSGGRCPFENRSTASTSSGSVSNEHGDNAECWALLSWGELCTSLSAPRFHNSVIDVDSKMLSFDVVKLMLECGGAHSLIYALERINLNHVMASTVASSLIKPLEILTRGAVYKTVSEMTRKDSLKAKEDKEARRSTFGPSHRCESAFADDAMLEEGFDADTAINARRNLLDEDNSMGSNESDIEDSMDDEEIDEDEIEVQLGGVEYSDDSEIDESDDDSESDEESDDDESSDDDEDMADDTENEDEVDEMDEDVFLEGREEDFVFDEENDFFGGDVEDDVEIGVEGRANVDIDETMDGWTRIDAVGGDTNGSGNIPHQMARALGLEGDGNSLHQQGAGGLLGAAESILGNILRAGDVGMDSLAELEDSLGIRISVRGDDRNGRRSSTGPNRSDITTHSTLGVPVNQSLPPDARNAHAGAPRGFINTNPMEYLFGGPAVVLGSESYDMSSDSTNERRLQVPSHYATDLFPGGLAASAHPRVHPRLHPLVERLELPPLNSLSVIQRSRDTDVQDSDPSTNLSRTNVSSSFPLTGWTDDGMPPDSSTEDFISTIGQSLTTMFSRRLSRSDNDDQNQTSDGQSSSDPINGDNSNADALADDDFNSDESDEEAGDNNASQETDLNNETNGAASIDSGENVASSLAVGLNISQPVSNDHPAQLSAENNQDVDTEDTSAVNEDGTAESADGNSGTLQEQSTSGIMSNDEVENPENQSSTESSSNTEGAGQANVESPPDSEEDNQVSPRDGNSEVEVDATSSSNGGTSCPPDVDPEVFASLPPEMQQEVIAQHNAMNEVVEQIPGSSLDPEALAALPEEMRREIIEEERNQQRLREREAAQPAADPANAEEIDPASFLASLTPELRQDILLTAEDSFLQGLPQNVQAEANALRERVVASHQRRRDEANANAATGAGSRVRTNTANDGQHVAPSRARRQRNGKLRVETDKEEVVYTPETSRESLGPFLTTKSVKVLLNLLYLVSPLQPQRVVHKLLLNLCHQAESRGIFLHSLTALLNNDSKCISEALSRVGGRGEDEDLQIRDVFPPSTLLGTAPVLTRDSRYNLQTSRRRNSPNMLLTVSSSLPASAHASCGTETIPPVVARRIISMLTALSKSSPRIAFSMLVASTEQTDRSDDEGGAPSCMERLFDLLEMNLYTQSATNLEQLLSLLEIVASPLSLLPKEDLEVDLSPNTASPGKEWVKVPRVIVSEKRLHLLINTMRLESCKESSFVRVNALIRRLSRVEANRDYIFRQLASVAQVLGADAVRDLRSVSVRLSSVAKIHQQKLGAGTSTDGSKEIPEDKAVAGTPSSAVSLSIGSSEVKLLRILQTLNSLCIEFAQDENAKSDGFSVEFASLCHSIHLESLWDQLSLCLRTVSVLEGVANFNALDDNDEDNNDDDNDNSNEDTLTGGSGKKLQNSVAGLITRFLPAIEAFFMVNASLSLDQFDSSESEDNEADNSRLMQFVTGNKVLLNALLRSNQNLLEKGLKAMVKIPNCRPFLDFDVKRQWFKTQVRRLRQQANRRHGSLRLNLRRKHVFEDSFHAFTHRSAEELRGRLQITFVDEEGVDAGGLSREFFAILAKEMFNPNYALFMSTEDGCTFQPNPNSSINVDHLRYFRFVGRIVGKAVVDGFLLDAHFTRSLYKHMLGIKPTHNDMQAIDPDYYKNLQMILQHNLEDIGLELTFSTEDHSFGRSRTIDLIPNGRNVIVTEERKEEYVNLVCQHRMTTAIEKQIKAYLEGFHDLVDTDLISIFNAKELELLISGMPDIDIGDLKQNTIYNGYRPADREIEWFWSIMFSLSRSEKAAFLQFVTGSAKVPLAGFSELQGMRGVQKFSINKANGPEGALMSAHTCFNALDLPIYKSEEEMKEKLLYAISEGGGGFLFA